MVIYARKMDDAEPITHGVYLHGELEQLNGFDLIYIKPEEMPDKDGEYGCWVNFKGENEMLPARLFFWKEQEIFLGRIRGLIVRDGDLEALIDARRKFNARVGMI